MINNSLVVIQKCKIEEYKDEYDYKKSVLDAQLKEDGLAFLLSILYLVGGFIVDAFMHINILTILLLCYMGICFLSVIKCVKDIKDLKVHYKFLTDGDTIDCSCHKCMERIERG